MRHNPWVRRVSVWCVVLGLLGLSLSASAVTITRRSGAVLYTDMNKGLYCCYAEYAISNDTASVTYSNVWVRADTFTGGFVKLGGGDPGLYHIDDLGPGQTKMAFFYLQATNVTSVAQSHTVRVYNGHPDAGGVALANAVFSVVVNNTLVCWSDYSDAPFMAGPGTSTEVIVPLDGRGKAFFKIEKREN